MNIFDQKYVGSQHLISQWFAGWKNYRKPKSETITPVLITKR